MFGRRIGRHIKRKLLYEGFSKPVYEFLRADYGGYSTRHVVNFSFDLEFAVNGAFWRHDFASAESSGDKARKTLTPALEAFQKNRIPCNIQVLGALLDSEFASSPILTDDQLAWMGKRPELLRLSDREKELLKSDMIELGLHGYSHRSFNTLSLAEAKEEIKNARQLFEDEFDKSPRFLSFPNNVISHSNILCEYGLTAWRGDSHIPVRDGEVPVGIWFSEDTLTPSELAKVLLKMKTRKDGSLLHLWGHFTEMSPEKYLQYADVVSKSGFELVSL